jgi:hypothetical protein
MLQSRAIGKMSIISEKLGERIQIIQLNETALECDYRAMGIGPLRNGKDAHV